MTDWTVSDIMQGRTAAAQLLLRMADTSADGKTATESEVRTFLSHLGDKNTVLNDSEIPALVGAAIVTNQSGYSAWLDYDPVGAADGTRPEGFAGMLMREAFEANKPLIESAIAEYNQAHGQKLTNPYQG